MHIAKQTPADQVGVVNTPHRWKQVSVGLACILISYAVFYRLVLLSNGWPAFDSDQAIMGLMSRHIWLDGEHPLFFYGQSYMGPLEAYAAVPVFALFGSSVLTLRLAMLPLIILFLAFVYILGRICYGPLVALLPLAWLSLGPSIAVFRELTTEGGKQEELVLSGVIVVCAWTRLRHTARRPEGRQAWLRCLATYGLIGAACGLAVWADWLSVPLILATVFALFIARPRELLSWSWVALLLGFVLGGWPFIQFNFTNQFSSFTQLLYFSGNGSGGLSSHLAGLLPQLVSAMSIPLPAVFGSPDICVQSSPGNVCSLANGALSSLIIVLYLIAAWPLLRVIRNYSLSLRKRLLHLQQVPPRVLFSPVGAALLWRRLDAPLSEADARRSARLWIRGILVTSALLVFAAFVYNPMDLVYALDKTRYLVPLYLSAPILFGTLCHIMRPAFVYAIQIYTRSRGGHPDNTRPRLAQSRKFAALAAGATLTLLLLLNLVNGSATLITSEDSAAYALPAPPWIARILAVFDAHDVRTFYSDSYYDCYNLAFEANERQVCAVLGPNGEAAPEPWINRYAPYVAAVKNDSHRAYLLPASPDEESEFSHGNLPSKGYVRTVVSGFAIYYYDNKNAT